MTIHQLRHPEIVAMAVDCYHGSTDKFSKSDVENALREELLKLNGGENLDFRSLRRNGPAIFEAMEEILEILLVEGLGAQFNEFVDVRNLNFGDKNYFMVDDYHLFPVATISAGNGNMRRQRLYKQAFTVDTEFKGVSIYEELRGFLAGRVNWGYLIAKVQKSFEAQIAADVYSSITTGYNALNTPYKYSGSYDRTQFNTLVQQVEAITQREATVFGTKLALQSIVPAQAYNPTANEAANQRGFYQVVDGIRMVEIKQSITPGTDNFAVNNKFLLVIPNGEEKICKLVLEGQPIIQQKNGTGMFNADDSIEWEFRKAYGSAVITSTKFGVYLLP